MTEHAALWGTPEERARTNRTIEEAVAEMNAKSKPSLAEQVSALKVGDKVRATFNMKKTGVYAVEGALWEAVPGSLFVGAGHVSDRGSPGGSLVKVEVLEKARPFYTNAPADRKPRIGDVAKDSDDFLVFTGRLWFKLNAGGFPQPGWSLEPGVFALVDPAELESDHG